MWMSTEQWWVFLVACTVLNAAPGPDTLYITTKTIAQGRLSGLLSAFGVCTGAMIHVTAAGIGLSAILAKSAYAFTIIKWVGAIYLMYLGYRAIVGTFQHKQQVDNFQAKTSSVNKHLGKVFSQGVLVDLFNPKTAMFFLAFIPQFVNTSAGSSVWQFIFLGLIVILNALVIEVVLIFFAAKITRFLRTNHSLSNWLERMMGTALIALGVHLISRKV